jgi:hypothetical protein
MLLQLLGCSDPPQPHFARCFCCCPGCSDPPQPHFGRWIPPPPTPARSPACTFVGGRQSHLWQHFCCCYWRRDKNKQIAMENRGLAGTCCKLQCGGPCAGFWGVAYTLNAESIGFLGDPEVSAQQCHWMY